VTSTLGGLLVAAIARAPADISAPTPSVVVIYASLCADLVCRAGADASIAGILPTLALAVVLAGVFLLLTGWFGLRTQSSSCLRR
jgi:MFS superfamily sulfate permease-like transporter